MLFGNLSLFTAVIANLAGQPNRPVKPDALYEPNLVANRKRKAARTPEEDRVLQERLMIQYQDVMNR